MLKTNETPGQQTGGIGDRTHATTTMVTGNDDDTQVSPYADHARKYWSLGWRSPLPTTKPRTKSPIPAGYTGRDGVEPSSADVQAWTEDKPMSNVALRVPLDVVGIDVDAYGDKSGGRTLAHSEGLWGALPPTWISTSRIDGISGIRFYRVPAGTRLKNEIKFRAESLGHIEIVQHTHRYAIVAPSIHPEGRVYRWVMPDGTDAVGELPNPADLPDLPERWLQNLVDVEPHTNGAWLGPMNIRTELDNMPAGTPGEDVTTRLDVALSDLAGAAGSRHDSTLKHVAALARLGDEGCLGVKEALIRLGDAFADALAGSRPGGKADAEDEFRSMLESALRMVKADPARTGAEQNAQLYAMAGTTTEQLRTRQIAAALTEHANGVNNPAEEQFWSSRDSLSTVKQWAAARMCSPWSVLGVVLCRALTTVPPWITLPPIIGGRGSLNVFVALVGNSGGGKGASESCAEDALPVDVHVAPEGSGEGLAHLFMRRAEKKDRDEGVTADWVQQRHGAMLSIAEVDTLVGIGGRSGSTIMPKLRNAFSGEEIGFSYADASKRPQVGKHNYRLTVAIGVQPEKAGPLLDDAGGGTPQRFLWLPTADRAISRQRPHEPAPLTIPGGNAWGAYARSITIPTSAEDTILDAHVDRSHGVGDALDGHALFVREKVAFALALLDGRTDMNEQDWELSAVLMNVSDRTRGDVQSKLSAVAEKRAATVGKLRGIENEAAEDVAEQRIRQRVTRRILAVLADGPKKLTGRSGIRSRLAGAERAFAEVALADLQATGQVTVGDGDHFELQG
ncbi:bifunctional DNA primase/polymerase [Rhodococcus jostii]|uniref:bifunctional DNA primase/polymerase n=1 Tax=Rhodococcus jostii TaxID=132919 RepID=UPI00363EAB11